MPEPEARTTRDLVNELRGAAGEVLIAALVVGFDNHTEFVWSTDAEPLEKLDTLVSAGGEPVGIITHDEQGTHARPLIEYQGEEWVEEYLISLLAQVRDTFRNAGIRTGELRTEGST